MYTPKKIRIPSALGAILAATLVTLVSAAPDVVHAQQTDASCAQKAPVAFAPTMQ